MIVRNKRVNWGWLFFWGQSSQQFIPPVNLGHKELGHADH